jgi:hypothetical protein
MFMHKMQTWLPILFCLAMSIARASAADDKPVAENHLAPVERFVGGEWTTDGKWSSGDELHARMVCEWGVGKKIIRTKTYVRNGAEEYQRYESIIAWHADKKSLVEFSFAFDGAISEIVIDSKEADTLNLGFTPYHADKPSNVRQIMQFKDKDTFTWKVLLKSDDGWQQIIESTWIRKSK